jgi:hypothetical protein
MKPAGTVGGTLRALKLQRERDGVSTQHRYPDAGYAVGPMSVFASEPSVNSSAGNDSPRKDRRRPH